MTASANSSQSGGTGSQLPLAIKKAVREIEKEDFGVKNHRTFLEFLENVDWDYEPPKLENEDWKSLFQILRAISLTDNNLGNKKEALGSITQIVAALPDSLEKQDALDVESVRDFNLNELLRSNDEEN